YSTAFSTADPPDEIKIARTLRAAVAERDNDSKQPSAIIQHGMSVLK
ncbi:MAG: hypothetical protein RLZZ245_2339, partial [Verrucomicrobiota bacterium]